MLIFGVGTWPNTLIETGPALVTGVDTCLHRPTLETQSPRLMPSGTTKILSVSSPCLLGAHARWLQRLHFRSALFVLLVSMGIFLSAPLHLGRFPPRVWQHARALPTRGSSANRGAQLLATESPRRAGRGRVGRSSTRCPTSARHPALAERMWSDHLLPRPSLLVAASMRQLSVAASLVARGSGEALRFEPDSRRTRPAAPLLQSAPRRAPSGR